MESLSDINVERRRAQDDNMRCFGNRCDASNLNSVLSKFLKGPLGISCIVLFIFGVMVWAYYCFLRIKRGIVRKRYARLINQNIKEYKLKQILKATQSFDRRYVIGDGGQGTVYHASIDGLELAIKKAKIEDEDSLKYFFNEVHILAEIHHPHVVSLKGYCYGGEGEALYLLYEFLPNKDVEHLLRINNPLTSSWSLRLKIGDQVAAGLSHLHANDVLHRDIKTANILLDENFDSKIADFGISKVFSKDFETERLKSNVMGTFGYMCPRYCSDGIYEPACDTYSFGVLLAVLLTGKPAVVISDSGASSLGEYFKDNWEERLEEMLDPRLKGTLEEGDMEIIKAVSKLISMCVESEKVKRPTMDDVSEKLNELRRGRVVPDPPSTPGELELTLIHGI